MKFKSTKQFLNYLFEANQDKTDDIVVFLNGKLKGKHLDVDKEIMDKLKSLKDKDQLTKALKWFYDMPETMTYEKNIVNDYEGSSSITDYIKKLMHNQRMEVPLNLRENLSNEVNQLDEKLNNFYVSPDIIKPVNNFLIIFGDPKKSQFSTSGGTHGEMSHAIKHLIEFEPSFVEGILNSATEIAKQAPDVAVVNLKNNEVLAGAEATDKIQSSAMLNTFELISYKLFTGQELNPTEKAIEPLVDQLVEKYDAVLLAIVANAIDVDNINNIEEMQALVKNKKTIKFTGSYRGSEFIYYLDLSNSGLIVEKDGLYRTLFRIDKKGSEINKIAKYFERGVEIKNPTLRSALGMSPSPVAEIYFDLRRWGQLSGILRD